MFDDVTSGINSYIILFIYIKAWNKVYNIIRTGKLM